MKKSSALVIMSMVFSSLITLPVFASSEVSHAPNPVKDFSIVFAIAIAAVVVGFIAFKSARRNIKE